MLTTEAPPKSSLRAVCLDGMVSHSGERRFVCHCCWLKYA